MAKVTAPLLAFDAKGQIAKTQVYANWRGIPYARRYVVPANPNTTPQQHTRGVFNWLNNVWKYLDPTVTAVWTAYAKAKAFTNRNAFQSKNVKPLRGVGTDYATDLSGFVASPGTGGAPGPASFVTADAGTHGLECTVTTADLPEGWALVRTCFLVFVQADAWDSTVYESTFHAVNEPTLTYTFAAIGAATYACYAFQQFTNASGKTVYGPSVYSAQVVA